MILVNYNVYFVFSFCNNIYQKLGLVRAIDCCIILYRIKFVRYMYGRDFGMNIGGLYVVQFGM